MGASVSSLNNETELTAAILRNIKTLPFDPSESDIGSVASQIAALIRDVIFQGTNVRVTFAQKEKYSDGRIVLAPKYIWPSRPSGRVFHYPFSVAAWSLIEGEILLCPVDLDRKRLCDLKGLKMMGKYATIREIIMQCAEDDPAIAPFIRVAEVKKRFEDGSLTLDLLYQDWASHKNSPEYNAFITAPVPVVYDKVQFDPAKHPEMGVICVDTLEGIKAFTPERLDAMRRVSVLMSFLLDRQQGHKHVVRILRNIDPQEGVNPSDFLYSIRGWIASQAKEFSTFEGVGGVNVTDSKIAAFISQFGPAENMRIATSLIEGIDYWSRGRLEGALKELTDEVQHSIGRRELVLIPMGGREDSAGRLAYDAKSLNIRRLDLREALDAIANGKIDPRKTVLLLFDDITASGIQACDMQEEYFGKQASVGDRGVYPLSSHQRQTLKKCEVYYATIFSRRKSRAKILDKARELGFPLKDVVSYREDLPVPYFSAGSDCFLDGEERIIAREMSKAIGLQLMADKRLDPAWTPERIEKAALGYSGLEQRIVFCYGPPTCTLTLFWKQGIVQGKPWVPLFPRHSAVDEFRTSLGIEEPSNICVQTLHLAYLRAKNDSAFAVPRALERKFLREVGPRVREEYKENLHRGGKNVRARKFEQSAYNLWCSLLAEYVKSGISLLAFPTDEGESAL